MPVKDVSCVFGALTTTGATAVILSLSSADITLSINGATYTNTPTKAGDDRGSADIAGDTHACYFTTQAVTGLTEDTVYPWTITQGVGSDSGQFKTSNSSKAAKFSIALPTCFNPNNADENGTTAYDFLQTYMQTTEYPMLAMVHADDIYYADGFFGANATDFNSQGKEFSNDIQKVVDPRPEYDYALNYAMWAGILEPFYETTDTEQTTQIASGALSPAFQWCKSNTCFMPQWGDHEFQNNIGWTGGPALTNVPNGYHETTGDYAGKGLNVWNDLMAPLQGTTAQSADTVANHWYVDFGSLRMILPDPVTNAVASTTVYGNNQIDDCLDLADGGQWFTAIVNPAVAGRGFTNYDAVYTETSYKDENHVLAEYNRLWVNEAQSPLSLMDNPNTNGQMGCTFMFRGDWHAAGWLRYYGSADTGIVAESFHEIGLCSVSGSNGTSMYLKDTGNAALLTDEVEIIGGPTYSATIANGGASKPNIIVMTILEVDGTLTTPQAKVTQWDIEVWADGTSEADYFVTDIPGRVVDGKGNTWRKHGEYTWALYGGNEGTNQDETPFEITKASSVGDE